MGKKRRGQLPGPGLGRAGTCPGARPRGGDAFVSRCRVQQQPGQELLSLRSQRCSGQAVLLTTQALCSPCQLAAGLSAREAIKAFSSHEGYKGSSTEFRQPSSAWGCAGTKGKVLASAAVPLVWAQGASCLCHPPHCHLPRGFVPVAGHEVTAVITQSDASLYGDSFGSCSPRLARGPCWVALCRHPSAPHLCPAPACCAPRQHPQPICRALAEEEAFFGSTHIVFCFFFFLFLFQQAPHMVFPLFQP